MPFLLALPSKCHCEEFDNIRKQYVQEIEIEKMRLEHRLEKLQLTHSLSLKQTKQPICQRIESKTCTVCHAKFATFSLASSAKKHHCKLCGHCCCSNCIALFQSLKFCTKCRSVLSYSKGSILQDSNFMLLQVEYEEFRNLQRTIQHVLETGNEGASFRSSIVDLFLQFEQQKHALSEKFGKMSLVLQRNFEHFCIMFYQNHKFTIKPIGPPVHNSEIETEECAVFEQQAKYLRKEINQSIRMGKIEDALCMRESLAEIEFLLQQYKTTESP